MRHTVLKVMKEVEGDEVRENKASRIDFVIIFRGIEGEPKRRLAPSKERLTAREVVGDEK